MTEKQSRTIEKNGLSVLTGRSQQSAEFMDSPTYTLSRMPFAERLWILAFLEAIIAIENHAADYFDPDYLMAVNEYLMRRSDLSVRMLNFWLAGHDFRSMHQVTDYLNERYRITASYVKENEVACRRAFKSSGQAFSKAWEEAVRIREEIPEELRPYDDRLGSTAFRQNPVAFLLSVREEERLRYIALLSEVIFEHRLAVRRDRRSTESGYPTKTDSRQEAHRFIRVFGNLLNTYVKYPEDPEIQALLLSVHMPMDKEDFGDDEKRRQFFNDRLRMAAYRWYVNRRGCRRAVTERWEEYGEYFRHLPEDPEEPTVPLLYLDEAVLNIPQFQNDPRGFLRYQLTHEQCTHFLTMLSASSVSPENAALGAFLVSAYLHEPDESTAGDLDSYFGWKPENEEERFVSIEQWIWDLVSVWRYNYRKCRREVKRNWASYEEAYRHMIAERKVPDEAEALGAILDGEAFAADPLETVREMHTGERLRFLDFCGGLHGYSSEDAASNAMALSVWMENPASREALPLLNRLNRWKVTGEKDTAAAVRDFLAGAAVSWKFNYGGYRSRILEDLPVYADTLEDRLQAAAQAGYAEEFRTYAEMMEDPHYLEDPSAYLRGLSQAQCMRFLLYTSALSDIGADRAVAFAALVKDVLFYPNPGNRKRMDALLEEETETDELRAQRIGDLLRETAQAAKEDETLSEKARQNWPYYSDALGAWQEKEKSMQWDLSEQNVHRLYRYCTAKESGEENAKRLYSSAVGVRLRSMLGELEILHHMREHGGHTAFYLEGLKVRRSPFGEKENWTESDKILRELLSMAVACELLAPPEEISPEDGEKPVMVLFLDRAAAPMIEVPPRG